MTNIKSRALQLASIWDWGAQPLRSTVWFPFLVLFVATLYGFALIVPGKVFATTALHDDIILLDGIYRLWNGQIPHLDFETALGALNFALPALFGLITDSPEMALLYYNEAVLVIMLMMATWVCYSRLGKLSSILFVLYMASIIGAPVNIGAGPELVSHAMLYNRFGWGAVMLVGLLILPSRLGAITLSMDILIASLLAVFMLYLKISYFVVIVGLLLTYSIYRKQHLLLLVATILVTFTTIVAVSILWPGLHQEYFQDLLEAAANSNKRNYVKLITTNLGEIFPFLVLLLTQSVLTSSSGLKRFNSTFWIPLGMGVASILLIANNAQIYGLPLLFSATLVLIHFYLESLEKPLGGSEKILLLFVVIGMSMPSILDRQSSLERSYRLAQHDYPDAFDHSLRRLLFIPPKNNDNHHYIDLLAWPDNKREELILHLQENGSVSAGLFRFQVGISLDAGVTLLRGLTERNGIGPVINLDFSNPFSWLLGLPPAKGDYLWYHDNRNISLAFHKPPEEFLGNARYVMEPKFPLEGDSTRLLLQICKDYLESNFTPVESPYWVVWVRD